MTATYWVYFILGMSGLALILAVLFARQVIGSGTPDMQRIAAAIKAGAEEFLKRQYKTWRPFWGCCFPHSPARRNPPVEKPAWCCRLWPP